MHFLKKKDNDNSYITGIKIQSVPTIDNNKKIYSILVNALINWLIVGGSIGCFIDAFKIKCDYRMIIYIGAFLSLYVSFLYFNILTKILGYLMAIIFFAYGIVNYRVIIKGGFGTIANKVMELLEKELDLPIERRYTIYSKNEKMAVAVCLVFIMFSVMLLFNMVISESKGFALVLLFSFPVFQLGMYFDKNLNKEYMIFYISGIVALYMLRNLGHHRMEYRKRKGYKGRYLKRKDKIIYDYVSDGKSSLFIALLITIVVVVFSNIVFKVSPQDDFQMNSKYDEMKENTLDFTKRLALVGFWGMLNNNGHSAGGVGRNRLGQSKYVSLDYQTDLIVKTAYIDMEKPIYLKAFNGSFYNDEYWETIKEHKANKIKLSDYNLKSEDLYDLTYSLLLMYDGPLSEIQYVNKNMEVINVGASTDYVYMPYYVNNLNLYIDSDSKYDDELITNFKLNWKYNVEYNTIYFNQPIPELKQSVEKRNNEIQFMNIDDFPGVKNMLDVESRYSQYVKDIYLDVPEINERTIEKFCKKYDLHGDDPDVIQKVINIFQEDYEYTLIPGKTPSDKEFVNYFLDESKKGYCTYFATAATLIFRHLNIPSRFTGGYVITTDNMIDGTVVNNEKISDWIGEKYTSDDTFLMNYEINDSSAHAWVEVYVDKLGWVPVEVTPSADEDEVIEKQPSNSNLVNYLSNNVFTSQNLRIVRKTTVNLFFILVIAAVTVAIVFIIFGIYIRYRRHKLTDIDKQYDYLMKCFSIAGVKKKTGESYEEYAKRLKKAALISDNNMEEINYYLEKYKFSNKKLSVEDVSNYNKCIYESAKGVYNNLKWYKKIVYRYVKLL